MATSTSTRPAPASAPAPKSSVAASVPAEQNTTPMTTKAPATQSPSASPGSSVENSAPAQGSTTTQQSLSVTTKAEAKDAGGVPTAHVTGSARPVTSGSQVAAQDPAASKAPSNHSITTKPLATEATSQAPRQTTDVGTPGPTAPPVTNSTSPDLLGHATPKPSEGPQLSFPTAAGSLGPVTGSGTGSGTLSTPQGKPATLTPVASSAETQGMPSPMPPSPASPSSSPFPSSPSPSPALQPSGPSAAGTEDTTGRGPTSSSTELASTALHGPSTLSPTSAVRDQRVSCGPPERPTEQLLILNLTRSSPLREYLAPQSPGPDSPVVSPQQTDSLPEDKLVTLLCRAAKPTFNPAQDQCHVLLAPMLGSHAVVVKEITIKTNLLPTAGCPCGDMQLGDQGPPEETEDRFSLPLIITIVCMASFLLLVAALYGCCHQRLSHRKDQQRLTEELQTVENGYHDNPTLEVMETSAEMQEKKVVNLNGELGDSWIVPLDNLTKDDLDEEEDTHL
uniref:Podocalyxin n=1 Tax=Oryctolagus cuniculus TaxID=9986 RepID=G1TXA1_RABIT